VLRWELADGASWDSATRGADHGPLVMRLWAPVGQDDVRDLALRNGLVAERYFYEMSRRLDTPVTVSSAAGVRLADWDAARADEARRVVNESFRDHWGHTDSTAEQWRETLRSHRFRPSWSVLAVDSDTGRVVRVALNVAWKQDWAGQGHTEGYTDKLGGPGQQRNRGE